LLTTLGRLPPVDRHLAEQGLHCGAVIDETKDEFERGGFPIRGVPASIVPPAPLPWATALRWVRPCSSRCGMRPAPTRTCTPC
jgi:hypothetical protein